MFPIVFVQVISIFNTCPPPIAAGPKPQLETYNLLSGPNVIPVGRLSPLTTFILEPDDRLYVSNWGFGPVAIGGGQVLKIDITCTKTMGKQ